MILWLLTKKCHFILVKKITHCQILFKLIFHLKVWFNIGTKIFIISFLFSRTAVLISSKAVPILTATSFSSIFTLVKSSSSATPLKTHYSLSLWLCLHRLLEAFLVRLFWFNLVQIDQRTTSAGIVSIRPLTTSFTGNSAFPWVPWHMDHSLLEQTYRWTNKPKTKKEVLLLLVWK